MVLNDLVDSFCYSQKNAGLKGLESILFSLYIHVGELFDVVADWGFSAHSYANNTQVYISTPASD